MYDTNRIKENFMLLHVWVQRNTDGHQYKHSTILT